MARTTRWMTLIAMVSLSLAVGCSDDISGTTTNATPNNQNNGEPSEEIDDTAQLLYAGDCEGETFSCTLTTNVGTDIDVEFQLLNAQGDPITNALIGFDFERTEGASDVTISQGQSFTDGDGVASTTVRTDADDAEDAMGSVRVTGFVDGEDDIDPLTVTVGINPESKASYVIRYHRTGDSTVDRVRPALLDPSISCSEALDSYFDTGFWDDDGGNVIALPSESTSATGQLPDSNVPGVENNQSFTVVAYAEQDVGDESPHVAFGCNDDNEPVEFGTSVFVDLDLDDHLPHLDDVYQASHQLNISNALPSSVQTVIDVLSTLADSPAQFILGCPDNDDSCTGTGLVDLLADSSLIDSLGYDIADYIDTLVNGPFYGAAEQYINDLVDDWLIDGLLPSWVGDGIQIAGDLTSMLQEFTVEGPIYFDQQPIAEYNDGVVTGQISSDFAHQEWHTIVFQWSSDCNDSFDPDECAEQPFSLQDYSEDSVVNGAFDGTLHGSGAIEIEMHELSLHYGAILIGAIEQVALPRIFGPQVTSINDMLNELINCSSLAAQIGTQFESTFETICFDLLDNATQAVYDYVGETLVLEADGDESHFQIGTPEGEHCSIQQPEAYAANWPGNPMPYIETFGLGDDGMACSWHAEVDFTANGSVNAEIPGSFSADAN